MTMEHWTDRLSEYVDGDLDAATAAAVDQHLVECDECSAIVADLRFIAKSAAALDDVDPPSHVWAGIAAAINAPVAQHEAGAGVIRMDAHRTSRRSITMSMPQLAAAAIVLLMFGGAVVASLGPRTERTTVATAASPADTGSNSTAQSAPSEDDPRAAVQPATADVRGTPARERTQPRVGSSARTASRSGTLASSPAPVGGYDAAISELESAAGLEDGRLDPNTTRVLRQSMQTIDGAIADAREALATDPANGYLHRHLDRTMKQKLDLLRQASKIERGGA